MIFSKIMSRTVRSVKLHRTRRFYFEKSSLDKLTMFYCTVQFVHLTEKVPFPNVQTFFKEKTR